MLHSSAASNVSTLILSDIRVVGVDMWSSRSPRSIPPSIYPITFLDPILAHLTIISILISLLRGKGFRHCCRHAAQSKGNSISRALPSLRLYFGKARQKGTSHRIYKTPWQGDPRVNIQDNKGMANAYQVRQVLKAIERLEGEKHAKE